MTRLRVVTTRQADADIETAIDHYLNQGAVDAAVGFVESLEDTKVLLSEHPHLGSIRFAIETNIPEIRAFALQRFPYIAFYTQHTDTIRIHRPRGRAGLTIYLPKSGSSTLETENCGFS